jgi:hypothetical protein
MTRPSRREFLAAGGGISAAVVGGSMAVPASGAPADTPGGFRYCLNFATLQGYKSDTPRGAGGLMGWAASKAVGPSV